MFVLPPPIRIQFPRIKKAKFIACAHPKACIACLLVLSLLLMFLSGMACFGHPSSSVQPFVIIYPQGDYSAFADNPQTVISSLPDNFLLKEYPILWSLALTIGVVLIAFLSKYLSEEQSKTKKEKIVQYKVPQSPSELRKPLTNIFLNINSALEKLDKSDPNGTANNLIAIEGECIHILQYIEDQPNIQSLNQNPMKEQMLHQNLLSATKDGMNGTINSSESGYENLSQETHHDELLIIKVMEQIHLNQDNTDFNVEMLCRKVGMSYSQLHRKVTLFSGKNPNQLIKEARLAKAKELLLNHEINIADVAFFSGYNDPSYFSRIFTKEFGITPSEFRDKNKSVQRKSMNLFTSV